MSTHKIHGELGTENKSTEISRNTFLTVQHTYLASFNTHISFKQTFLPQAPGHRETVFPEPVGLSPPPSARNSLGNMQTL